MTIVFIYHMSTKEKILKYLEKNQDASGKDLSALLSISRQALNKHLKELIQRGVVVKEGATRGAVYKLAAKAIKKRQLESSRRHIT